MRTKLLPLVLFAFTVFATPTLADDEYKACLDKTGKNDEWARCGGELIGREEKKMTEVWDKLMAVTDGDTKTALETEQKAWNEFRRTVCQIYADQYAFGREGQVLSFPYCVAEAVKSRTVQLRDYLRQIDP